MSVVGFKSIAAMAQETIDRCRTFERRGPKAASLISVNGAQIDIRQKEVDWTDVLAGRPCVDMRNDKLFDLIPSPRASMQQLFQELHDKVQSVGNGDTVSAKPGPRLV